MCAACHADEDSPVAIVLVPVRCSLPCKVAVASQQLSQRLKTSLDELRMQMLGVQVLFGFQFQSLSRWGSTKLRSLSASQTVCALAALLASLSVLVCAPAQHRLVEEGEASRRLWAVSEWCAEIALATMALALGCVAFSLAAHVRFQHPLLVAALTSAVCLMVGSDWVWR